ncbi:MAG: GNAT family N-acetyltransferase [Hydrogenimonas sp.]|nr:GNAT family N-acetyltransferase [Hydrogenimonas sp.]
MFKCIEAKDPELIKEIYKFRYQIACEEEGIFDKNNYPDEYESDEYDKYSLQYVFLNKKNTIVACVRLIYNSKIGYPTLNNLKLFNRKENSVLLHSRTAELSRIFIKKEYRSIKNTRQIIDLIKINTGKRMEEMNIVYSYGALERSFFRLLQIFKMPYRQIGPFQMYGRKMRAPCIMYTDELIELNKELFIEKVC